jgi:hypothetical protein
MGTILLFFGVGAVVGLVRYWPTFKQHWRTAQQTEGRASAQRIMENRRRVLANDDPPKTVAARNFAFRDGTFYKTNQAALERLGFTLLGDFSLDQAEWTKPGFRAFFRVMSSDDRETLGSILDATPYPIGMSALEKFHFYAGHKHTRYLKTVSLRTELNDGTFLITATEGDFVVEELPPQILKETVRRDTPSSELLKRHRERIASAVGQTKTTVVPIGTVEEFGESFVRHHRTVRAFREQVGVAFTDKEQRDFTESESPLHRETAQIVLDTMRTLDDDRKKQAS